MCNYCTSVSLELFSILLQFCTAVQQNQNWNTVTVSVFVSVCVCCVRVFTLLHSKYFSSLVQAIITSRPHDRLQYAKTFGEGQMILMLFHAMSLPVLGPVQKTHCSFRTENDLHNSFPQFGTSLPLCLYY